MRINVLEYFEAAGRDYAWDKIAIVDRERQFTFAHLKQRALRCANQIGQRTGALREAIAVYLPRGAEIIFADLGIVYSGNAYMNLDVKVPHQRTRSILEKIEPALIITSTALISELRNMHIAEDRLILIDEQLEYEEVTRWRQLIDTDPLCIINTSGSTGVPKGVALNHRSTIDFVDWGISRFHFDSTDRIGNLSPLPFDLFTFEWNLCLAKGATIVIIPENTAAFPSQLVSYAAAQAVTFLFWVPSIMVNIANQGLLETEDLSCLKRIFFAGEVFPTKHLNRWRRALPHVEFVNLYGPIEITVDCTYLVVDRDFDDDEPLPIGHPCRNTDILLLNDTNELCERGERGELCVRGSSLAMGYWNDPERTAATFVQNPLNRHYPELIYRTGDYAYTNERGELMFVGRKDFQIKHLGYRIELAEIEERLLQFEGIGNACVLYNNARKEITAFYQAASESLTPAALRTGLSRILPKYMLPTRFESVAELPRSANGKIDRQLLLSTLA